MPMSGCDKVATKLKDFNRVLYQNRWIEQAREDEDPNEEPFDLKKEYELASIPLTTSATMVSILANLGIAGGWSNESNPPLNRELHE